jgi:hypothetical protein
VAGKFEACDYARLLFPNKPTLDDSERTTLYTGIQVQESMKAPRSVWATWQESYIDFGPRLMFLPILLLRLFYGFIYRCFVIPRSAQAAGQRDRQFYSHFLALTRLKLRISNRRRQSTVLLVIVNFVKSFSACGSGVRWGSNLRVKVVMTIPGLDPRFGGPSRTVPALCRALHSRGVEVELVTLGGRYGSGAFHDETLSDNFR